MSIKSDRWIRRMARERGMIEPFVERQVRELDAKGRRVISYGVSSLRLRHAGGAGVQDLHQRAQRDRGPQGIRRRSFVEFEGDVCIVPPNSFALARSVEYFRIPREVLTICVGKSTYARCGIITNVTPFEPEWEGHVTLEISNTTPLPAKIYANEGICQVLFFEADADDVCEVSYADKAGKYQSQTGVTLPEALGRRLSTGPFMRYPVRYFLLFLSSPLLAQQLPAAGRAEYPAPPSPTPGSSARSRSPPRRKRAVPSAPPGRGTGNSG